MDEHIRLSMIKMKFEEQKLEWVPRDFVPILSREKHYTPAQIRQVMVLRHFNETRAERPETD